MDYSSYNTSTGEMSTGTLIIYIAIIVVTLAAQWKIFVKAGKPGWAAIVPFYNLYVAFEIAGMNGWMFLLLCIPIVNIVFAFKLYIGLAKAFGKGTGFGILSVFFTTICMLILGFGSAEYVGKE